MKKLMGKERLSAFMDVILSLTVVSYSAIIGIVVVSILFVLPIFNK